MKQERRAEGLFAAVTAFGRNSIPQQMLIAAGLPVVEDMEEVGRIDDPMMGDPVYVAQLESRPL